MWVIKILLFCISFLFFHHDVAMGLVCLCLQPITRSSRARLQQLYRVRGTGDTTAGLLIKCTSINMSASTVAVATERAQTFLSNLKQRLAHNTTPWWIVMSPQFYDLFRQRAEFFLSSTITATTTTIARPHFQNETLPVLPGVPDGPRWAIANQATDLSGTWIPLVTSDLQESLDTFLSACGQPYIRRKIIVQFLGLTQEVIRQTRRGRELEIVSANPMGRWNRTLVASGTTNDILYNTSISSQFFETIYHRVQDPEGDTVQIEAWWESDGSIHQSWLRGSSKVNGMFQARRYLESRNVLVCESFFHPSSSTLSPSGVVWRYRRQGF